MGTQRFTVPDANIPRDGDGDGLEYVPRFSGEDESPDPITKELAEDPAKELGVPPEELAVELDRLDGEDPDILDAGDLAENADDMREYIQDADEGDFDERA